MEYREFWVCVRLLFAVIIVTESYAKVATTKKGNILTLQYLLYTIS